MDENIKSELYNQIIRVFLSVLILFGTDIPLFLKILFIYYLDGMDKCDLYPCPGDDLVIMKFFNIPVKSNTSKTYQIIDKIGDTIIYIFLWIYYLKYYDSPSILKAYISLLFFYRLVGTILYLTTENRRYLLYFPNFFLESLLVISVLQSLGYSYQKYKNVYIYLLFIVIIFKLFIELIMHSNS